MVLFFPFFFLYLYSKKAGLVINFSFFSARPFTEKFLEARCPSLCPRGCVPDLNAHNKLCTVSFHTVTFPCTVAVVKVANVKLALQGLPHLLPTVTVATGILVSSPN